jgi:hypothetical protein
VIIHSDRIGSADIYNATDAATRNGGGPCTVRPTRMSLRGSRKRARAFDVTLSGSHSHRQNGNRDAYAATYDEWGWFLAHLFTVDPEAIAGPYGGADDFHRQTANVYTGDPASV